MLNAPKSSRGKDSVQIEALDYSFLFSPEILISIIRALARAPLSRPVARARSDACPFSRISTTASSLATCDRIVLSAVLLIIRRCRIGHTFLRGPGEKHTSVALKDTPWPKSPSRRSSLANHGQLHHPGRRLLLLRRVLLVQLGRVFVDDLEPVTYRRQPLVDFIAPDQQEYPLVRRSCTVIFDQKGADPTRSATNENEPGALQSFTIGSQGVLTTIDTVASGGDAPAFCTALSDGQVAIMNVSELSR